MSGKLDFDIGNNRKFYAIGIVVVLLFGGYFIGVNPERVSFDEYGIEQNVFTGKLDDHILGEGLYHVGFWKDVIIVTALFQNVEFKTEINSDPDYKGLSANDLSTQTRDGVNIQVELSFQFRVIKDRLYDIYVQYKDTYTEQVIKIARDVLRDAISKYFAIEMYANRTQVGDAAESALSKSLSDFGVEFSALQLRNVDFPAYYDEQINRLVQAQNEIEIARQEQQAAIIQAETLLIKAKAEADADIIRANGSAQAFLIETKAQAQAVNITLNATGQALYELATVMNWNSTELLAYLWIEALRDIGQYGNMVIIGQNTPSIILNTNNTIYT